jgi:arginine decarboxylase
VRDPEETPLAAAYDAALVRGWRPMVIPGHKGSTELTGSVVAGDVSMWPGLDTLHHSSGRLPAAQALAAQLWGADWCRFSVGGSTHGNQTLALAVGRPGDEVVATRAVHRSLLLGFVLAGLTPVWVEPDLDPASGLPVGIGADRLGAALADHPRARAVFVVEPGYVGTRSDVAALAAAAHAAGAPLVVDQAWGAHLGFHPGLPEHALAAGADALVTSAHKTLPAYTQGAIVLAMTARLDPDRLDRAFDATHTTSPSGTVLASIDAARSVLASDGSRLLGRAIEVVAAARARLREVDGLLVLDAPPERFDPTKLVVGLAGTGADGMLVEGDLLAAGFPVEMADRDTIVATVTMADSAATVEPFAEALAQSVERRRAVPRAVQPAQWLGMGLPAATMTPRDAFFAPHETVSAAAAVGRVCAELVAPYPPGIAALVPGEVVGADILAALRDAAAAGVLVSYAADPSLASVQVVAKP